MISLSKLSKSDLTVLTAAGFVGFDTFHDRLHRVLSKYDGRSVPAWWAEAAVLSRAMTATWKKESKPLFEKIYAAIDLEKATADDADIDALFQSGGLAEKIGERVAKKVAPKVTRVHAISTTKAQRFFDKLGRGMAKDEDKKKEHRNKEQSALDEAFSLWLASVTTDQTLQFAKKYPTRILHPEVQRLVRLIQDSKELSPVAANMIRDRLLLSSYAKDYWEKLNQTEASFMWNSQGLTYGMVHGIKKYAILNPLDKRTCPVCKRLHGTEYTVQQGFEYVQQRALLTDPKELAQQFPFPRIQNLEHLSLAERQRAGFLLPPFHCRCRDQIVYIGGTWNRAPMNMDEFVLNFPGTKNSVIAQIRRLEQRKVPVAPITPVAPASFTEDELRKRIGELQAEHGSQWKTIAGILNDEGYTNAKGNPLTPATVRSRWAKIKPKEKPKKPKAKPKPKPENELPPGFSFDGQTLHVDIDAFRFTTKKEFVAWAETIGIDDVSAIAKKYTLDELDGAFYYLRAVTKAEPNFRFSTKQTLQVLPQPKDATVAGRYMRKSYFSHNDLSGGNWIELSESVFMHKHKKELGFSIRHRIMSIDDDASGLRSRMAKIPANQQDKKTKYRKRINALEKERSALEKLGKDTRFRFHPELGKPSFSQNGYNHSGSGVLVHEWSHAWHHRRAAEVSKVHGANRFGFDRDAVDQKALAKKYSPTEYGTKNYHECFAESLAMYMLGEVDRIDPKLLKFFDKQFPRLAFGKKLQKGKPRIMAVVTSSKREEFC
jgi:hypothetical protein